MKVYVKSESGRWLMPTNPANARILIKQGRAKVIQRVPFAIQLLYETAEHTQAVAVGIDDGGVKVGIAAVSGERVLYQEEVTLRTDIKSLMDTRRQYRRSRRNRKTRYRKPRFLNRRASIPACKVCGGNAPKSQIICRACLRKVRGVHQKYAHIKQSVFRLPPSIKAKKDAIIRVVGKIPLPVPVLIRLEDAYFDFQAMENPNISGREYKHGVLLYHKNFKSACLTRDNHKCRVCASESDLRVHHVKPKSEGGTDKLSNLMTLCEACHEKHHKEGLKLPKQKSSFYISASHVQQGKNYFQSELGKVAEISTSSYILYHFE
ncbi:MAG: restriction endonuclease [Desulfobacteraceae bacterium]|nr:restriction endonuclease [Desulfobacteraceae bacterium]